jgi:hypothetical protein
MNDVLLHGITVDHLKLVLTLPESANVALFLLMSLHERVHATVHVVGRGKLGVKRNSVVL